MMQCSICGEEIRPNARFCLKCGKPVQGQPAEAQDIPVAPAASEGPTPGEGVHQSTRGSGLVVLGIAAVVAIGIVGVLFLHSVRQLTREDAVRILHSSSAFQASGSYFRVSKSEQAAIDPRGCFQFQNKPGWQALTDLGWATLDLKTTSQPTAFAYAWYGCTLQLTPDGQQGANQWRPWSGPLDTSGWEIPLATAAFIDVTGVTPTESDSDTAQVQYTFRWNPTPFAQALGRLPDGGVRSGTALFHRFENGWTLQDLGFGSLPEPQMLDASPSLPGQAEWTAYMTNEHVSTTVNFDLSSDGGNSWQSFSLAPRTMGVYKHMNRFRVTTNFPDGHTQMVNCPLPPHGSKYYSINCQGDNCTWDLYGDDEFVAARGR
jgi:hypothetical protein